MGAVPRFYRVCVVVNFGSFYQDGEEVLVHVSCMSPSERRRVVALFQGHKTVWSPELILGICYKCRGELFSRIEGCTCQLNL